MAWLDDAACRSEGIDPEIFFAADESVAQTYQAKRICAGCPVRTFCAQVGLRRLRALPSELSPEDLGIYGGLTGRELAVLEDRPVRNESRLARDRALTMLLGGDDVFSVARQTGFSLESVRGWVREIRQARESVAS